MISIVIPTYNEEHCITLTLDQLCRTRGDFEVIVSDGGSTDLTVTLVRSRIDGFPRSLRLVESMRHRALQLNRGAALAHGDLLLFLHADVVVPPEAIERIDEQMRNRALAGGNFQVVFEGRSAVENFFTWVYRVRRPFGIYYGDSGVFVRREVFERLRGFKAIPIMDDYEFIRRLERCGPTVCLEPPLLVSDRRWRVQGLLPTLFSWVWIQTLYSLGVPAERLARWYAPVRDGARQARGR
jgi:rSAM/selenodomain-associated transferase 2